MPRLRPPYVAQVGPVRPADARAQLRDAVLGARHRRARRATGSPATAATAARACARSRSVGPREASPGVHLAPAGITLRELIDEYCGGMLDGHTLYAYLPGGASGGILPASLTDIPLDFDTLQPYGCFIGSAAVIVLSQHDTRARRRAQHDATSSPHESCGQCTPCRVGTDKAAGADGGEPLGPAAARRPVAGDGRRLDLRPRPGGAEPDRAASSSISRTRSWSSA